MARKVDLLVERTRTPGARGRIGIIQPAPGVMLEHEWPRWLPSGVLFPVARMRMPSADEQGYAAMAQASPEAARDLASARASVVAYACTVGSLFAGPEAELRLLKNLSAAAQVPAISLADASFVALKHIGATRIAVLTPYAERINRWVVDYAVARGLEVVSVSATPVGIGSVGDLPPETILATAVETLARSPQAEALWMPCTAMQTLDALAGIEAVSGRPAISGSQALLWRALGLLGIGDPIDGAGSLFSQAGD